MLEIQQPHLFWDEKTFSGYLSFKQRAAKIIGGMQRVLNHQAYPDGE
ncbi:MAG TPA: hypothetical protein P5183_03675 [Smithellaceae bacterium]|nr:hypothetical protein [Smithellaceae bacterium]